MKTFAVYSAIFWLAATFSGFPQSAAHTQINGDTSISEIVARYTNFQQITRSVVFVNPELAMLCAGVSKEAVDAARVHLGPHANTGILIYMNDVASFAFRTNANVFPVGAVVVKKKAILGYTENDGKRVHTGENGVGGMVKRSPGYNPQHGDWEYFYFENAAKIESGRIASCVKCHDSAKDKDYVFGTWRKNRE